MNRKKRNILHILLLFIICFFIHIYNPSVEKLDLLKLEKLFELNLVLLGVGISLITFLYTILVSLRDELTQKYQNVENNDFYRILKSININVKRFLGSLFSIVIIIIIKDVDIPVLYSFGMKAGIIAIFRLFILLYILASIADITLSTLKLYEMAFKTK